MKRKNLHSLRGVMVVVPRTMHRTKPLWPRALPRYCTNIVVRIITQGTGLRVSKRRMRRLRGKLRHGTN